MKSNRFNQYIQYRALAFKFSDETSGNFLLDISEEEKKKAGIRQVCTQVGPDLFNDLEYLCGLLGITKRQFVTLAIADAVERAGVIIRELDVEKPQDATASTP